MNESFMDLLQGYNEIITGTTVPVNSLGAKMSFTPFFSSIRASLTRNSLIQAINGGTYTYHVPPVFDAKGLVTVRMGDYDKGSASHTQFYLPYDLKRDASETLLRRAASETVWDAIDDYLDKLDLKLGTNNADTAFLSFSHEQPVKYTQTAQTPKLDGPLMQELLEQFTGDLELKRPGSCEALFTMDEQERYFANSEQTAIYTQGRRWGLLLKIFGVDKDNRIVRHLKSFTGNGTSYPSYETLMCEGRRLVDELEEMIAAPIEKNGAYPAILNYANVTYIIHEALGHSAEADRMHAGQGENVANLFIDRIGDRVGPEFITVYDDPTRADLGAHYMYDEEGVLGQMVPIVKDGRLLNYLHSRESAGYFNVQSNGHARAEDAEVPQSRMSNLMTRSSKEVSYDELEDMLIRECKKQRKPYGLIMEDSQSGISFTQESFFKSIPVHVFRLYPDGHRQRVRDACLCGTPSHYFENILATSDRYNTDDAMCGAESGFITSSETAPDALFKSVEVNRLPESSYEILRNDILPCA